MPFKKKKNSSCFAFSPDSRSTERLRIALSYLAMLIDTQLSSALTGANFDISDGW